MGGRYIHFQVVLWTHRVNSRTGVGHRGPTSPRGVGDVYPTESYGECVEDCWRFGTLPKGDKYQRRGRSEYIYHLPSLVDTDLFSFLVIVRNRWLLWEWV